MTRALDQPCHLKGDDLHVAARAGQRGQAGAVADGHHEQVAVLHPDDRLPAVAQVEQPGAALGQAAGSGRHRRQLLGLLVGQLARSDQQQPVGRDHDRVGDARHLGHEVVDQEGQRPRLAAERVHVGSASAAGGPPSGPSPRVPPGSLRGRPLLWWISGVADRASRWPSRKSARSSRIRPARTPAASGVSAGAGGPGWSGGGLTAAVWPGEGRGGGGGSAGEKRGAGGAGIRGGSSGTAAGGGTGRPGRLGRLFTAARDSGRPGGRRAMGGVSRSPWIRRLGVITLAVMPPYGRSRSWTRMPCRWASRPTTYRPMCRVTAGSTTGARPSRVLMSASWSEGMPMPESSTLITIVPSPVRSARITTAALSGDFDVAFSSSSARMWLRSSAAPPITSTSGSDEICARL